MDVGDLGVVWILGVPLIFGIFLCIFRLL